MHLFVYYVLALGISMPEPLFEEFQVQVFQDPEVFLAGNKASVLEHHCTYIIFLSILEYVKTA
jgi:hypothetical protein